MRIRDKKIKAIIIGASSGIGCELAKILARNGYEVGLVARRIDLLLSLQKEIKGKTYLKQIDISNPSKAIPEIESLILEMGNIDLVVLNAGVGFINSELDWKKDKETIDVNVSGFCSIANVFMKNFLLKGKGHLVGISSIAALRGSGVYSASKAFVSNYLEGLRHKAVKEKKQIIVTDIKPGFVDTDMAKGKVFWMTPAKKCAELIYKVIQKKKYHAYITSRWRLIAWLLKCMPRFIYDRLF
ncbi:MAG: putative oxidoreductase [Candidatus Anoxychlamydiales bacterium]|nr:putative oxidoreductase [Candidatus Anoxychlamydiales bacterium]